MTLTVDQLRTLLVAPGHVPADVFAAAAEDAARAGVALETYLVDHDVLPERNLGHVIAEFLGVPLFSPSTQRVDSDVVRLIPELVAQTKQLIAFGRDAKGVRVALRDPNDLEARYFIEKRTGEPVIPYYVTASDLRQALTEYKSDVKTAVDGLIAQASNATAEERDDIVVALVNQLLQYGFYNQASDVHIEPHEASGVVRFRIDGVLHDVLTVPTAFYELIATRVKILAKLRTDEHRAAQDGRLEFTVEGENVDVRVSVVPVMHGENIVLRLLTEKGHRLGLADLGLGPDDLAKVEHAIARPHGMILVTGPTGSGKTTTVYAVLKLLNHRDVHIATIEDPVEYDVEGISQIQVNAKTNLTFAAGLRAIVRQDPDIIMVGEVRDEETASIAVNSAMTGHLVLTTLHANDAATTLPRLLDMGVEPFLVASTVNVSIAQRLVRRICMKCRASSSLTDEEQTFLKAEPEVAALLQKIGGGNPDSLTFYRGSGCDICGHTGYRGRVGIFEVMEMSETLKPLVLRRASSTEIVDEARRTGMHTMLEDGFQKVLQGVTTVSEVVRAAKS